MKLLRDLRLSTELLLLLELLRDPRGRLKTLSEKLGMTAQGVSEYLRRMQGEGLIQQIAGGYRLSNKGVQFLHENIVELRDFVVDAINRVDIIRTCAAVARTKIKRGDRVGLFMERGILTAYARRRSASTGISTTRAELGEIVRVKDLDGIVELSQGQLVIIELPAEKDTDSGEGPSYTRTAIKLKNALLKLRRDRLGALDTTGLVLSRNIGLKCDFEFAAGAAGIEAAQKGLDAVLIGEPDEAARLASQIDELNSRSSGKLKYEYLRL
jgi:putative transcriptional regulator